MLLKKQLVWKNICILQNLLGWVNLSIRIFNKLNLVRHEFAVLHTSMLSGLNSLLISNAHKHLVNFLLNSCHFTLLTNGSVLANLLQWLSCISGEFSMCHTYEVLSFQSLCASLNVNQLCHEHAW